MLQTSPEQHVQRSCGEKEQSESEEKEEASRRGVQGVCVCVRERDEAGVTDVGSLLCSRQGPASSPHSSSLTTSVCSH